jgi:hypothetical protein
MTALISAGVAVVTAFITYMTARHNARKDIFITDRQQLSKEQQDFRKEMREELNYWRAKYDKLEEQMNSLATTNVRLQAEVELWKEKYEVLAKENEKLVQRVNELEGELRRRRRDEQ